MERENVKVLQMKEKKRCWKCLLISEKSKIDLGGRRERKLPTISECKNPSRWSERKRYNEWMNEMMRKIVNTYHHQPPYLSCVHNFKNTQKIGYNKLHAKHRCRPLFGLNALQTCQGYLPKMVGLNIKNRPPGLRAYPVISWCLVSVSGYFLAQCWSFEPFRPNPF